MHLRLSRLKSRSAAARFLLSPVQIKESLVVVNQPGFRNSTLAGVQVAVTALVVLPLIQLSAFSHLIGFASLGTLVALFGRFAPPARRSLTVFLCLLCQTATVFVMSMVAWSGVPMIGQLAILALICGTLFYIANVGDFGPPGALIFIFAASVSMGQVTEFSVVLERSGATAAAAALAWLVVMLTEMFRHDSPVMVDWFKNRPLSHQLIVVGRMVLGAAVAAYAAHGFGGKHAGWAAMGAVAVLQGSHLHISMSRALQRTGGNVLGATLVALLLMTQPSVWTIIALVAALSFATEAIIGSNYGLGQILVTPMALLMSYLAAPDLTGIAMAQERVVDTLIGTAVGITCAIVFSTLDDRANLLTHHIKRAR
ncbi:MAG: hypothetical protein AWU57_725 [Marinobacter sp. T13-3]|nr:MAG: hypothetical protein AWU57_725 [Marinobacter sp. T13-3]